MIALAPIPSRVRVLPVWTSERSGRVVGMVQPPDMTGLLHRFQAGDSEAAAELVPLVHDELHRLAHRALARTPAGQTLQTTALLNEAWLRIDRPAGSGKEAGGYASREHFLAIAEARPELARVVEQRFFAGMKHPEIARVEGVSLRTIERNWRMARAWLHARLTPDDTPLDGSRE